MGNLNNRMRTNFLGEYVVHALNEAETMIYCFRRRSTGKKTMPTFILMQTITHCGKFRYHKKFGRYSMAENDMNKTRKSHLIFKVN